MTDREKLYELIRHIVIPYFAEQIADHLIANGVVAREKGEWDRSGYCSVCDFWTCYCGDYHFCPNCGADMRKGENG